MGKTFEDRVSEEVNKRIAQAASAAGVDRGRIEIEVLFLLPPEFVRRYRELFDRALADPVSPSTDGGKDEGRIKASGKPSDPMRARSMGAAGHSKRFVSGAWPIRSEQALEAKRRLDKRLILAVTQALDMIGAADVEKITRPHPRCPDCGFFQKPEWLRCPYHP
jgi:hypothetical protein